MANACDETACLKQNLKDALLTEKETEECLRCSEEGNRTTLLHHLYRQRRQLLEQIHHLQKALDSLDYLIFRTEKEA